MITDSIHMSSGLAEDFIRLKSEMYSIIAEGRTAGLNSEVIADEIMNRVMPDKDIVIAESTITERPVNMKEIVLIARKAVEQAAFDGASIVLTSGKRIKKKVHYRAA